ncbi:GspL domain-containing protein [Desulfuromusa kysingii]|uniref:GspL domain-containing protein n=1 Tax=Desulfuromusa kysingii TaxID=37625 RepID=A0A1H3W313_9BACT|nr:type II secretion system protein GspL [Desulfuromusa kysingii]SDZ81436.1 GspL domain-containing protein [Desulfuromusa kysingii]
MSKRFIGIDLEGTDVRVAILTAIPGKIDIELDKRSYENPAAAAVAIKEMLGGKITLRDRLITALPCRVGLFRRLRFPFREKNKIEAALPLELRSQLPISLEEHVISFLPPRAREDDYEVDAVVVNKREIDELLTHFPDPEQNPRRIDLFPFALLPILREQDGILVYCRRLEVVVALVYDGMIRDYRLLPGTSELNEEEIFDFIASQVSQLENTIGHEGLPLWIIGAGVTEDLLVLLYKTDRPLLTPAEDVFADKVSYEMAPAALLALSEMREEKKSGQLNFRQGEFSARGQLEVFRAKLIAVALLTLLVVFVGAMVMHLDFLQKTRQESSLKQQMETIFRQIMPENSTIVDVPLQLESQLKDLQEQVQLFGLGGQGAAQVLQGLSSLIDRDIRVDFRDFNYDSDGVNLAGNADSFEAVNQIAESLKTSPLFGQVEIIDAKLAADNSAVDFQLQLKFLNGGER